MKKYYCPKCMGKFGLGESEKTKETRCTFCREYDTCFITEGTLSTSRSVSKSPDAQPEKKKRVIEKLSGPLMMDESEDVPVGKPPSISIDVLSLTADDLRKARSESFDSRVNEALSRILARASNNPTLGTAEAEVGDEDILAAITEKLKEKGFDVNVFGNVVRASW